MWKWPGSVLITGPGFLLVGVNLASYSPGCARGLGHGRGSLFQATSPQSCFHDTHAGRESLGTLLLPSCIRRLQQLLQESRGGEVAGGETAEGTGWGLG